MADRGQLRELSRARLLLFLREPEALVWVFVFPLVLALVLAFAFRNQEVEPSAVGVVAGALEADALSALQSVDFLEVTVFDEAADAARELRSGAVPC